MCIQCHANCILQLTERYLTTLEERDALKQQVSQVTDQMSGYFIMIQTLVSENENTFMCKNMRDVKLHVIKRKVMEKYFWSTLPKV